MRSQISLATLLLASVFSFPAWAITQPDGTPIPAGNGLQGLFDQRGEAINALSDAQITPETFIPACALSFTVLQRNAGYKNAFGWYNVTGQAPTLSDLHEFLLCSDDIGVTKVLDIKKDPAYLGGEVGFYQGVVTSGCNPNNGPAGYSYVFYSEKKYNPDNNQSNPFIHLLIYNSTVTPKAFYFGWEDLISGGDNDFDDLTTFVTGITCSGGGAPCETGSPGVCGSGTMQCQTGQLVCVSNSQPSGEKCDGLDNDCDGQIDEGDDLCSNNEICDHGVCIPRCVKDGCDGDFICNELGYCVDPKCTGVSCEQGKVCIDGQCTGPCDGVTCPTGQVCRVGACVDPCNGLTCDGDQVCSGGVCVEKCQCGGCKSGETCQPNGQCLSDFCASQPCSPGTICVGDTCVDPCLGASCPKGQVCQAGSCILDPNQGNGGASGAGGDAGSGGEAQGGEGGSTAAGAGGEEQGGEAGQGGSTTAGAGGNEPGGGGSTAAGAGGNSQSGGGGVSGSAGQGGAQGGGGKGGQSVSGAGGAGQAGAGAKAGKGGQGGSLATSESEEESGCGCSVPGQQRGDRWSLAALALVFGGMRRRRR